MGNYNPRVPFILGEEWVPIRDEELVYSPVVNSVELGTEFALSTARRVRDARFYLNEMPSAPQTFQTGLVGIYPAGLEDQTGPISQVIIPCNAVGATGAGITSATTAAIAQPGDDLEILITYPGSFTAQFLSFFFAVNQYPVLANKRILNVSLLYAGSLTDIQDGHLVEFVNPNAGNILIQSDPTTIHQLNDAGTGIQFTGPSSGSNTGALTLATSLSGPPHNANASMFVRALDLGDINNFWDTTVDPTTSIDRMPWRYVDLQRLEAGAADRQHITLTVRLPETFSVAAGSPLIRLEYVALRVIYCEERRIAYGAKRFNPYVYGVNIITMRDLTFATDPILTAGGYLPTLSWVSPGQVDFGQAQSGEFPELNALRELYQIPPHPGVQVDIPFPLEDRLGETFESVITHILPQLSLHASGGTLTEPHVYGRQGQAQVYGVNTAMQELYDNVSGFSAIYPQVRYYARRFGDTTIPLTLTGVGGLSGSTVSITPADFDELAEILDGWREVTLRFASPPTMGAVAGEPGWTWSAPSETAGNRWEILAACAPAISGIPGNLYNLVPPPNRLDEATYEPPGGSLAELTWMPQGVASPWVTGATADDGCDAVLIFSQDPPTVTGVSISQQSQTVTGLGLDCGSLPCCVPSGIGYQRITWSANGAVCDTFERTETAQWGNADTGQPWVLTGGAAADYNVVNGVGTMALSDTATREATQAGPIIDVDVSFTFTTPQLATGDDYNVDAVARRVDTNNYYRAQAKMDIGGTIDLTIQSVIAGVATDLDTELNAIAYAAGATFGIRLQIVNTTLRAKIWNAAGAEPLAWMVEATDATFTTGGVEIQTGRDPANTNAGLTIAFDNFAAVPVALIGGAYELQRWDYLDPTGDFQTIMRATDICTNGFNDYEARVGVTSVYRVRSLNALNFAGAWSTYVSGTPAAPGVTTGACDDMNGVLIFTSNADQSGQSNAAYVMQWEREPVEEFALPEAGMVEYQPMYGRDGSVAFHGTERGFETFARTVLLQAGAISPVALADASTIRDLAWANLPYVCVRDELGDRWLSSVLVPSVAVRHNRTKYMARIEIVEVTATPYAVNP